MPMDGVTLGFVARELRETLVGGRVDKIAQPERDELQIMIRCRGENRQLLVSSTANCARIHLTHIKKNNPLEPPMFCMLLRKHLTGGRVADVRQINGDRILELDIESTDELGDRTVKTLVCECMGKHSNIMLLSAAGKIIDSARHVTEDISRVREVLPGLRYERPPAQDKLPYDQLTAAALAEKLSGGTGMLHKALSAAITGLSVQTARELAYRVAGDEEVYLETLNAQTTAERVAEIVAALPGERRPLLLLAEDGAPIDVVAFPYRSRAALKRREYPLLSEAMDEYYRAKDASDRIKQKSSSLHRVLKNNLERCEKKLGLQTASLAGSEKMEEYRVCGELLTAGLAGIRKGQKFAMLPNYYDPECKEMRVPLDEKLSPAQNAQRYFKLYQKARSAKQLAAEQIALTREELDYLEGQMENLAKCTEEAELNEIREELERLNYVRANHNRRQLKQLPPSKPMKFVSQSGIPILVGKNNLQNDKLTQTADPNDTWLHAKNMPGSHVVIVGDRVDEATLKEAALLAAKYSKGGSSSQVPVDYTLRKYVKKPSGAKPGFVIYTHQRTLYVTP